MSHLSPLSCKEAFDRLADYVDRELTAEEMERVRAHLDLCATCAREFRFEATVLEALKERLRRIAVPPDLVARVTATLQREHRAAEPEP
jgi:anti-sigma factor (TIGR02949 family)